MNPCVMSNTTPLANVPCACTHHGCLYPQMRIPWACKVSYSLFAYQRRHRRSACRNRERGPLRVVSFLRHMPRRHVAYANDGQIADLPIGNEALKVLVIPGVPVEEVNGDEAVASLDLTGQLPLRVNLSCKWLLGED